MSWLDKSVNENKGVEMIGDEKRKITFTLQWEDYKRQVDWFDKRERELQDSIINGTSEVKCGQGILAYIREQEEKVQEEVTIKDLEEVLENAVNQSSRRPQWFMSYGEVKSYHEVGMLKDIMEDYELCIGIKSFDFIKNIINKKYRKDTLSILNTRISKL